MDDRGSALIWWVIVIFVFFIIATLLAYVQYTEAEDLKLSVSEKQAEVDRLTQRNQDLITEKANLALKIGFGATSFGQEAEISAIDQEFSRLRGKYNTVTDSDNSFEKILKNIDFAYDDQVRRASEANSKWEQARTAEAAAESETQRIADAKDAEIDQLRNDLQNEKDRATRNEAARTELIDKQREQVSRLTTEKDDAEQEYKKARSEQTNRILVLESQFDEINTRNRMVRNDRPDGKVLDADADLGLVFINIGSRHGLKSGTPFQVFNYGKGLVRIPKGWIEVREVKEEYSVAGITEQVDPLNPITPGDMVTNLYFSREKTPVFVFLGDLPGRYNNEEAARILRSKGAVVDDLVSANTDFLVVGVKPAGEGAELEESETFKLARQYGVEIIRPQDLTLYIRY